MTPGKPDPGDYVKPHPEQTVETILKAMEKIPDEIELDGQTRLSELGFQKEDFGIFKTYIATHSLQKNCADKSMQVLSERLQRQAQVR